MESPQELLAERLQTPLLTRTQGTVTGEGVCWHAAYGASRFAQGARQTGDGAYVQAGITYFDSLIARLYTAPDGHRGWVGPYIYDESIWGDVHVADAILVGPMLDLAEYVRLEAPPEVRTRFGPKAAEYVDLAEQLLAKWEDRGTWLEDGQVGGYVAWDRFLDPADPGTWQQRGAVLNAGSSLPSNKQQDMGIVHLRLYRLTGSAEHRRKAVLIFSYTRSRLSRHDGYYTWDYWEPFYPGDVDVAQGRLRHWVNTHPYRDYQTGEVDGMVEAFHSGIVFSAEDMRRLVRTNLRMWNGDEGEPRWVNSDREVNRAAVPGWEPPPAEGSGYPRLAGTLWRPLAEFDSTLARLAGRTADNPQYARRRDLPVTELEWPVPEVTLLQMGCVLPASLQRGEPAYLVSKARVPGPLRITLMDESGAQQIQELFSGQTSGGLDGLEGILIRTWQAQMPPGTYRVRWALGAEQRDCPIFVR
ncbi:MAG: hypothetical protein ABIL09_25315 [Gemmatimonadota bacterium]